MATPVRLLAMCAVLGLTLRGAASDDKIEHGFRDKVYKDADGTESKYVVFVPHSYQAEKAYPVVLFLHNDPQGMDQARTQADRAALATRLAFRLLGRDLAPAAPQPDEEASACRS